MNAKEMQQSLYITHVDRIGLYLKISGQPDPKAVQKMRTKMLQLLPSCFIIDSTRQHSLMQRGTLCLYKRSKGGAQAGDVEVMRAQILNVEPHADTLQVEVEFIDYGYTVTVTNHELLFTQTPELLLPDVTVLYPYIVLDVVNEWKQHHINEIARMIRNQTLEVTIKSEFKDFKFITMKWKEFAFAEYLIHHKKMGAPIASEQLRDTFIKFISERDDQAGIEAKRHQTPSLNAGSINNNNSYTNYNINNNVAGDSSPTRNDYAEGAQQFVTQAPISARLQRFGRSQQMNMVQVPMPRMPQTIGNYRSLMQGLHMQNNRIPFNGMQRAYVPQYVSSVPAALYNPYSTRHHLPSPIAMYHHRPVTSGPATTTIQAPERAVSYTFKMNNLPVGHTYDILISYVENGPCLFSVQLASEQEALSTMMSKIESIQLRQLSTVDKPVLGTACIARYSEDGQLYRALITSIQPTACKVVYVDYGNVELVQFNNLYQIPQEFLQAKAFSMRFTLSGHKELEPIDDSLKRAFKDLVLYQHFKLRVMPLEGPPLVPYCQLYTTAQQSILDVLKEIQKCRLGYAKAIPLRTGEVVEIRYIDSPRHFYVQQVENIEEFEQLMDDMFAYYNKNQVVPNQLVLGAPCIVKYDNEWYRAEVMRADASVIIVRHVDFGYEQKVTKNLLSNIAEKHLRLPRQAVQCCLKGFENNELSKELATTQFEMLAEESNRSRRAFTVKVFRIHPDGVNLVNLSTKDLNVMKKLYKLSMPFEEYLSLEKDEFRMHPAVTASNRTTAKAINDSSHKAPSTASSTEVSSSVQSVGKKVNILNSTTLQSEERMHKKQINQQQRTPTKPQLTRLNNNNNNKTSQNPFVTEWDKNSNGSSLDNRDSRSSSSEYKQGMRQHQRQSNHKQQANLNVSSSSSDHRSTASGGSGKRQQIPQLTSPRQAVDNRRDNRQQQQQQQRSPRSQNAPQGYAQQHTKKQQTTAKERPNDGHSTQNREGTLAAAVPPVVIAAEEETVVDEYMPLNRPFPTQPVETPAREDVIISWWISPHQFYTHLKVRIAAFDELMREMQRFYRGKSAQPLQLKVGSHVVARYRKENTVYRARILACNQMLRKYKLHFVDVGNQYTVTSEDIWPVAKRFADFPCMAQLCSFRGIVSHYDHLYIIDRMERYLPPGADIVCEYVERTEDDMYYVNVEVKKASLRETLAADGLITYVCPELRLNLLAGQQIRAKIIDIKDMLNFKIQIEGNQLLCSYDDMRYVKSNPDTALKFKSFYEGASCVLNIKDVNDNKVVLLRPLLPLLKSDIPSQIATQALLLERFEARMAYVSTPQRVFVHMAAHETRIADLLKNMRARYENAGMSLTEFDADQLCAAKSSNGHWYRARITAGNSRGSDTTIEVLYIDYGKKERVDRTKLKRLEDTFYRDQSAYAVEVNLPLRLTDPQSKAKSAAKQKPNEEANSSVVKAVQELTSNRLVAVQAIMVRNNRLIADIILPEHGVSLVDALKTKQLIRARDVEYVRRQLDREPPNMLAYMETVDLTLEDEESGVVEATQERKSNKQAKTTSPKKKIVPAAECVPAKCVANGNVENGVQNGTSIPKEVAAPPLTLPTEQIKAAKEEVITTSEAVLSTKEVGEATKTEVGAAKVVPEPIVDVYADMEQAILSHCDNPGQFFVHLREHIKELEQLQENLQIVASSLPPLIQVKNGVHCVSMYSVDKQWYRARIIDAELMVLKFIDYGNTDCVNDTSDVRMAVADVEPFCLPCALPIRPNGTVDWVDAANAIFNESYGKPLYFEYITRGDAQRRSFINLHIDGVNVATKLIEQGYGKPLELVLSGENCYISHVNTLGDFYIQYEKDSKALELIEIYLESHEQLKRLEKFERSKIVAALFPEDQMWYRAKLIRELPQQRGYEVLFIDYGNTSTSPECRELASQIAAVPPLSKRCSLELPETCAAWSEEAEKLFAEIAGSGETIYTVELREPAADRAIVQMLIDGRNISDELAPLCDPKLADISDANVSFSNSTVHSSHYESGVQYEAIVSHVNTPWDFYVQFSKDTLRLEDMTTSLNTIAMDQLVAPSVGELCAARFKEDNAFYRARLLDVSKEHHRVLFLDFGNEEVSDDLRALPLDLQQLQPFAQHCQLESPSGNVAKYPSLAGNTFDALIDGCAALVLVDFVDSDDQPAIVRLFTHNTNENLHEKLCKLLSVEAMATTALLTASIVPACRIAHAESPTNFYVQLKSNAPQMEQIVTALSKTNVSNWPVLSRAELNQLCIAYANEDSVYYRGRVRRVNGGSAGYEIFLLDYGNCITTTQLYELPEELSGIPLLALRCRLNVVPEAPAAVLEEQFAALLEAHFGEVFEIEEDVVNQETGVHTVKLQANYKDLAKELAQAIENGGTATQLQPTLHDCTIIHVNSPISFYVQMAADITAVEQITDELLDAETNFPPFVDLQVGAICAAQFPDDGVFYRAEIVSVLDGKCEVHYLDFGNNSITDQFRELPEKLLNVERYSKHCALEIGALDVSMPEAFTQFQALVDSRFSETFQAEILKTTAEQLHICRLFYQNKNVATELTQLLKGGDAVVQLSSPSSMVTATVTENIAGQ